MTWLAEVTFQSHTAGRLVNGQEEIFSIALLLCFILIGFLAFLYMIIVTPDGTLTVS